MKNDFFSFENAEDSSGFLLWQVTVLWQRGIKTVLEKFNLTHAQYVLLASLAWLTKQREAITQIDLSNHSNIDPMTTSTVLRTLLKKDLIQRSEHHADTRAKVVSVTSSGSKIIKQAVKAVEHFDHDFFAPLGGKINNFNQQLLTIINQP